MADSSTSSDQSKLNHIQEEKVEDSNVFHKPALYWYRLFTQTMGAGSHHSHHGLSGYETEEELRMKRDSNLDRIDALARKERYVKRKVEHKVRKDENYIASDRASLHNQQLMATQRTTAIKFEINHDMMWHGYYKQRLQRNQKNLQSADSRTANAIQALMKNDKERMAFYMQHAKEQYSGLKRLERKENVMSSTIAKPLKVMTGKITMLRLGGEKKIRKIQNKIAQIREDTVPIEKAIKRNRQAEAGEMTESKYKIHKTDPALGLLKHSKKHSERMSLKRIARKESSHAKSKPPKTIHIDLSDKKYLPAHEAKRIAKKVAKKIASMEKEKAKAGHKFLVQSAAADYWQ